MKNVTIINHPLVQHKLTLVREEKTSSNAFRKLIHELSLLLAYEVTRDFPLSMRTIDTPFASMESPEIDGKKIVIVSILRAGNSLLQGMLDLIPAARVGHIGLYRNPKTRSVVEYYFRMPDVTDAHDLIIVDPMIASGYSASVAISRLKKAQPKSIKFVSLIASKPGIACLAEEHPDVQVYTAAVDEDLNGEGYIVPGIGDAGDRMFGTK